VNKPEPNEICRADQLETHSDLPSPSPWGFLAPDATAAIAYLSTISREMARRPFKDKLATRNAASRRVFHSSWAIEFITNMLNSILPCFNISDPIIILDLFQ